MLTLPLEFALSAAAACAELPAVYVALRRRVPSRDEARGGGARSSRSSSS